MKYSKQLSHFGFRANVESFTFKKKKIFIYQDHRTILNALFFSQKNDLATKTPNIIYFDYHDDGCQPREEVRELAKSFNLEKCTEEEFNNIVEYKLNPLDDDWVKTGMDFELINHAISIGAERFNKDESEFKDINGNTHELYNIPHLSHSLGSRGCLGDSVLKYPYYERTREIFGFNTSHDNGFSEEYHPFILDFDLDCFSAEFRSAQMAWPEWMFIKEMTTECGYDGQITPFLFLRSLIERCEFITICTNQDVVEDTANLTKSSTYWTSISLMAT